MKRVADAVDVRNQTARCAMQKKETETTLGAAISARPNVLAIFVGQR